MYIDMYWLNVIDGKVYGLRGEIRGLTKTEKIF